MDKIPARKRSDKNLKIVSTFQNSSKSKNTNLKRLESAKKHKKISEFVNKQSLSTTGTKGHLSSVIVRPKRNIQTLLSKSTLLRGSRSSPRFNLHTVSSNSTTSSEESEPTTRTETIKVPIQKRLRAYTDSSSESESELTALRNKSDSLLTPTSSSSNPAKREKLPPKKSRIFDLKSDRTLRSRPHSNPPASKPRYQVKIGNSSSSAHQDHLKLKPISSHTSKPEPTDKPTSSRSKHSMEQNPNKPTIEDYLDSELNIPDELPSDDLLAPPLSVMMQQHADHPNRFMEFLKSIGRAQSGTDDSLGQVISGIQEGQDEATQFDCLVELTQMLLLGSEDTLGGLPIKVVVPALIKLLRAEHNDQLMLHSCRALCYLMEALPRSSALIIDAIPHLLEKLENIVYIDVAEQALSALELLAAQKHALDVLECGGVSTVLQFYEFFSVNAKRSALNVAANCCTAVTPQNFPRVANGLTILTQCLNPHGDRRALEAACNAFSRLAENLKSDSSCMRALTEHGLLLRIQELLLSTPPCLTEHHMKSVLHTLGLMAQYCPSLGAQMFIENFGSTLNFLIGGSSQGKLAPETQQVIGSVKFFEILYCLSELMPTLPKTGIFEITTILNNESALKLFCIWEWEEDDSTWHPYSPAECRMIETAFQQGQKEATLPIIGRQYSINFTEMTQINKKTRNERSIRRQGSTGPSAPSNPPEPELTPELDPRERAVLENMDSARQLFQSILPLLFDVLNAAPGSMVQQKCLLTIIRMVRVAQPEIIHSVLQDVSVSSYLAALLASKDFLVLIPCLQLSSLLLEKLDLFSIYFRKEGVVHQIEQLKDNPPISVSPPLPTANQNPPSQSLPASLPPPVFHSMQVTNQGSPPSMPPGFPYPTFSPFHNASGWPSVASIAPTFLPPSGTRPQLVTPGASGTHVTPRITSGSLVTPKQPENSRKGTKGKLFGRKSQFSGSPPPPCPMGAVPLPTLIPPMPQADIDIYSPSHSLRKQPTSSLPQRVPLPHDTLHFQSNQSPPIPPYFQYRGMPASVPTGGVSDTPINPYFLAGQYIKQHGANKNEKVRQWLIDTSSQILTNHFSDNSEDGEAYVLINKLKKIASNLCIKQDKPTTLELFMELSGLITEPTINVSSFELTHSNLVHQLLRIFSCNPLLPENRVVWQEFLHIFFLSPPPGLPLKTTWTVPQVDTLPVLKLVQILQNCVNQSEQFPARSDLGGLTGSQQFFRFINNHQLKCQLVRHQSDKQSKEWKKRPIQVDPLATLYSVEKYLVMRGLSRDNSYEDGDSSDESMFVVDTGESGPNFEFLLNDKVVPHNITMFELMRKMRVKPEGGATQSEDPTPLPGSFFLHTSYLSQTLTLHYRQMAKSSHLSKRPPTRHSARIRNKTRELNEKVDTSGPSVLVSKFDDFLGRLFADICAIINFDWSLTDPSIPFIKLLSILSILNEKWHLLYSPFVGRQLISLVAFHNNKLSAKVDRVIQEPMAVLTSSIPVWIKELSKTCPSIFSFNTRRSIFYCTTFDRARAMMNVLEVRDTISDTGEVSIPRIPKRKVTIGREELLEQAIGVLSDTSVQISILEVRFKDEVGTGLGPTLEFYSLVSLELQKRVLGLWHDTKLNGKEYFFSPDGLYPNAFFTQLTQSEQATHLCHFQFLGRLFAKSILDAHLIDLNLSPIFYYWLLNLENHITPSDFFYVDNLYQKSINSYLEFHEKVSDIILETTTESERNARLETLVEAYGGSNGSLDITFIVPGSNDIELTPGGLKLSVTSDNLQEYIYALTNWFLVRGVRKQMNAFIDGFTSIIPLDTLSIFHPTELGLLTGGRQFAPWTKEELHHNCRLDHGYTHSSTTIGYLFNSMANFNEEEQRQFLQFVTGTPRLPIGGFSGLTPPLTIVKKQGGANQIPDSYLPSVMTCVNYLKLPEYTSEYVLKEKLTTAITEGQKAFHLS